MQHFCSLRAEYIGQICNIAKDKEVSLCSGPWIEIEAKVLPTDLLVKGFVLNYVDKETALTFRQELLRRCNDKAKSIKKTS